MRFYVAVMFWLGIIGMIRCAINLVADHPRPQKSVNIGTDVLSFIVSALMLGWVSILYLGKVP